MAVEERDPHTGYMTTGHEWNGIKELNTPVPRPVYFFLIVTALFAVVYWILMPAWPLGVTYTKGLLGIDQRTTVNESLKQAALERGVWTKRIESRKLQGNPGGSPFDGHRAADRPNAVRRQLRGLPRSEAQGGKGFPNLTTASWLWGGDPESIAETIRVGINSAHPQTQDIADDGFRARSDAQEGRDRERRGLRAQPFRPGRRKGRACGENRRRQGGLRGQLRHLPW